MIEQLVKAEEIHGLIGTSESHVLEFKADFSGPIDKKDAKTDLVKEVVAFSNAHGGTLIIGVAEKSMGRDKPAVASHINPLDRIQAKRAIVEQVIKDGIEPMNPNVRCKAVEIGDGNGVIIVSVGMAPRSPVMSLYDNKAYRRVGTISQKMSMWEIQDMVIERAREIEGYAKTLERDSSGVYEFAKRQLNVAPPETDFDDRFDNTLALMFSMVPLERSRAILDYDNIPRISSQDYMLFDGDVRRETRPKFFDFLAGKFAKRPILGGIEFTRTEGRGEIVVERLCVYRDGRLNGFRVMPSFIGRSETVPEFFVGWLEDFIASTLSLIVSLREIEGYPRSAAIRYDLGAAVELKPQISKWKSSRHPVNRGFRPLGNVEVSPYIRIEDVFLAAVKDAQHAIHVSCDCPTIALER